MRLFRKKNINDILNEVSLEQNEETKLKKVLTVKDLTSFGIAAIIGAGIFSTIGKSCYDGGPAVIFLFIFTAIACAFSALSYAEFSSRIPVSGSAYTYAYASFGELVAWIIGWDLLMEYAIGNIAVAISWSDYFTGFLSGFGIMFPTFFSMDYLTAYRGFQSGDVSSFAYNAWINAPQIFGIKIIADLPALAITFVITCLVYVGIKESRTASNLMVLLKLFVIVLIIIVGFFYVQPSNWNPFIPNGISGIMMGVSAVFFAYIGFDAISTTAEECQNPQRDLPKAMFYSLFICTILYVLIALVLTGIINFKELNVGDPLAFVFQKLNLNWFSGIVGISAIVAMSSVLLVFQLGQPRIWMSMSRDGLLPKKFSAIHPKYKTPHFSTIITGLFVAIPALFLNLTEVTDLTSIGTLFAFVLVNGGVLLLKKDENPQNRKFKIPYINGKIFFPVILFGIFLSVYFYNNDIIKNFFDITSFEILRAKIPMLIFLLVILFVIVVTFIKNLSLIPILGLTSCLYLMTELGIKNWERFFIWLAIGLVIYFTYGFKNSKLNNK